MAVGFQRFKKVADEEASYLLDGPQDATARDATADTEINEPSPTEPLNGTVFFGDAPDFASEFAFAASSTGISVRPPSFEQQTSRTREKATSLHLDPPANRCDHLGFVTTEIDGINLRTIYPDQIESFTAKQAAPINFFTLEPNVEAGKLISIEIQKVDHNLAVEEFRHELNDASAIDLNDAPESIMFEGLRATASDRSQWAVHIKGNGEESTNRFSSFLGAKLFATRAKVSAQSEAVKNLPEVEANTETARIQELTTQIKNLDKFASAIEDVLSAPCYSCVTKGEGWDALIVDRMTGRALLAIEILSHETFVRIDEDFAAAANIDLPDAKLVRDLTDQNGSGSEGSKKGVLLSLGYGSSSTDPLQQKILQERVPNLIIDLCTSNRFIIEHAQSEQVSARATAALQYSLQHIEREVALLDVDMARNELMRGSGHDVAKRNARVCEMALAIKGQIDHREVRTIVEGMPHYTQAMLSWLGEKDSPSIRDRVNMVIGSARDVISGRLDKATTVISEQTRLHRNVPMPTRMASLEDFRRSQARVKLEKAQAKVDAASFEM
ncbi:hypothetical protein SAMN02744133_108177 [Thalassospira xiamenensis M-5 = DSM 17429]|uniref:Uncharacterized protein n=1 Tax=Thalassospira xiamenensis M-5 = DSM 17429 TaxID=1123366 RepID=A0AB72UJF6_9PROT|nr:hypothetical protein [Thalassospira xiamenensis]AJD54448.1 hypothetical protein TH3_21878 [Thalassospira xiamenensis M-5 = DSM 17429]SIT22270.1 hypothetical protein SAMN02744133_108177 [Thalassospira xiamenensis M-5 = DSM 17429]